MRYHILLPFVTFVGGYVAVKTHVTCRGDYGYRHEYWRHHTRDYDDIERHCYGRYDVLLTAGDEPHATGHASLLMVLILSARHKTTAQYDVDMSG